MKDQPQLGKTSWETPIGFVTEQSMTTLNKMCDIYGDIEPWGKGPSQVHWARITVSLTLQNHRIASETMATSILKRIFQTLVTSMSATWFRQKNQNVVEQKVEGSYCRLRTLDGSAVAPLRAILTSSWIPNRVQWVLSVFNSLYHPVSTTGLHCLEPSRDF